MGSWTLRPCILYNAMQLKQMYGLLTTAMQWDIFVLEPHRVFIPSRPSIQDVEVRLLLCCVKYHMKLPIDSSSCPRYDLLKFVLYMCGTIDNFLKTKSRIHFLWRKRIRAVNDTHSGVPYCDCVYPKLCLVSLQHRVGVIGVFDICFSCPMRSSVDEDGFIVGCQFSSCR